MRDISLLHPKLQMKITELRKICGEAGLKISISETLRTEAEQDALYAKGRTESGSIVTNAKGSTFSSMHQWGVAFDFYRTDGKNIYYNGDGFFYKVGEIGKKIGLIWGGDWESIADLPHFQLADWGNTPSKLKKQYKTPEEFFKTWEDCEMTAEEKEKLELLIKQNEELSARVTELEKACGKVYRYTQDLPNWARDTIQKLLTNGIYQGAAADDLNLPEVLMRSLIINDRAGVYK